MLRDKRQDTLGHQIFGDPDCAVFGYAEMGAQQHQLDVLKGMRVDVGRDELRGGGDSGLSGDSICSGDTGQLGNVGGDASGRIEILGQQYPDQVDALYHDGSAADADQSIGESIAEVGSVLVEIQDLRRGSGCR